MNQKPRLYGWWVSPYTAKSRAHLRAKNVDFDDVHANLWTLMRRVNPKIGRVIMPTMELADGTWLQDSSDIFDHVEEQWPQTPMVPNTPKQRVASFLFECFADEWLPMSALHYRWNTPENRQFAINEFAKTALPYVPSPLRRRALMPQARKLKGYLKPLGVTPETIPGVEETSRVVIQSLDQTLSATPFVFGNRPSLADFSLYGPLWAHLYRDPGSRHLFQQAPNVVRWFERLQRSPDDFGPYLSNDHVPESLNPILRCIFQDQWAWHNTLFSAINAYCDSNPDAQRVPRALGVDEFSIRERSGERKLVTFVQWKAQRAIKAYGALSEDEASTVNHWIQPLGGETFVNAPLKNPFIRRNYRCVLKNRVDTP